ncbi:MAG: hypothetical protein BSOLF_0469 [Candidatus Carbobacillus altaicus]|uniref:Uncharacterized protein n=1 Tax=Candidatus Carbonibacillus altaicus TaxID=2163959 RepID=A0A2R6XXD8_9BACL|nr:MAG: hypothetical protein BSOLF_0469 [Candidatus Carbobacillus altaicus]
MPVRLIKHCAATTADEYLSFFSLFQPNSGADTDDAFFL